MDPKYHPKIIGKRGLVISKIRTEHDVNIQFPNRGSEREDIITISGYEAAANAAKDDILKIVTDLVGNTVTLFLCQDSLNDRDLFLW